MRILFVCLGNICRSPAGEGLLRHLLEKEGLDEQIFVTSCGMGDWHLGQLPDPRIRHAASKRGVTLASRAKPFVSNYMDEYDLILAADQEVLEYLYGFAKTPQQKAKVHLMTAFSTLYKGKAVPDPFYQGEAAFDHILDMLEDSCHGIVEHIKKERK